MKFPVTAIVFLLILVGTIVAGTVSRRTGLGAANPQLLDRAAQTLARPLPLRVGNWQVMHESPLDERTLQMLRCPAHISRVYVHDQTGERVSVTVLVGPAGPIAVHTPEICFSSQDYKTDSDRIAASIDSGELGTQTFWDVVFRANDLGGSKMRVLYAWSDGTRWNASEQPRYTYGALPYLYKLQLAGPEAPATGEFDPSRDFLTQFLGQLEKRLIPAPSAPAWPL